LIIVLHRRKPQFFSGNSEMIEYTIEGFNEGRYQLIGVNAR